MLLLGFDLFGDRSSLSRHLLIFANLHNFRPIYDGTRLLPFFLGANGVWYHHPNNTCLLIYLLLALITPRYCDLSDRNVMYMCNSFMNTFNSWIYLRCLVTWLDIKNSENVPCISDISKPQVGPIEAWRHWNGAKLSFARLTPPLRPPAPGEETYLTPHAHSWAGGQRTPARKQINAQGVVKGGRTRGDSNCLRRQRRG